MADIPKKRFARSQRAPSGIAFVSPRIADAGDVSPGIRSLGAVLGEIGATIQNDINEEKFDDYRMDREIGAQNFIKWINGYGTNDDGTPKPAPSIEGIEGHFQGFLDAGVERREKMTSGSLRRASESWEKGQIANWRNKVTLAMISKRKVDAEAAIAVHKSRITQLDNPKRVDEEIADIADTRAKQFPPIPKELIEAESRETRRQWEVQYLKNFAEGSPQLFKGQFDELKGKDTIFRETLPEDWNDLWAAADRAEKIQNAEANAAQTQRAAQFESTVTDELVKDNLKINDQDILELIQDNPDITPATKRTLKSLYDATLNSMGKGKDDNDPYALADAYRVIASDATDQQKFTRLMQLRPKLKPTTVDSFIKDIYEPETVSNEVYKQYSTAINSLKTGKMFSADIAENINLSVKSQDLLRMFARQNPEATEEDYGKFFNKLIENQSRWWAIWPGGRPWSGRREKSEIRHSIPQNIAALEKKFGGPKQYKAGDKRTVNGVIYTFDGQEWFSAAPALEGYWKN